MRPNRVTRALFIAHVGAAAHGDSHVCLGQRRRVVDAVAGMATTPALGLRPRYRGQPVCRLDYFGVRAKTVTVTSMAR